MGAVGPERPEAPRGCIPGMAALALALGRKPSVEESQILAAYGENHGLENVCRLILNSNEFMFVD